jgi:putative acetyltransferase
MVEIREEQADDVHAIRRIHEQAFGQTQEADIVDRLRRSCPDLLSLVAVVDGQAVGHILFSPVIVAGPDTEVRGMGLAPMAVLPHYQQRGIGTELVTAGLAMLQARDCPYVIVLGHAEYYPRFGFAPASRQSIRCQWDGVPDEAFLILVWNPWALRGIAGVAYYRSEFEETA